jgi:hypothetical protein
MFRQSKIKRKRGLQGGFTLMELMITGGVLILVVAGILRLFIYGLNLSQMAGDLTAAVTEVQGEFEEIRNCSFSRITFDYAAGGVPGNIFSFSQLNGTGVIYIDDTNQELLEIEIVASWQTAAGRVIGEDKNLNGILDAGEDDNANARLDSPLAVVSLIAKR